MSLRRALLAGTTNLKRAQLAHRPLRDEPKFCINPWRERKQGDATVKVSEIAVAEFIRLNKRDDHPNNWFQVRTKDGRFIQSERYENDKTILTLMCSMQALGAMIYVRNV